MGTAKTVCVGDRRGVLGWAIGVCMPENIVIKPGVHGLVITGVTSGEVIIFGHVFFTNKIGIT